MNAKKKKRKNIISMMYGSGILRTFVGEIRKVSPRTFSKQAEKQRKKLQGAPVTIMKSKSLAIGSKVLKPKRSR